MRGDTPASSSPVVQGTAGSREVGIAVLPRLRRQWQASSLATQFLTVGGLVVLAATVLVGVLVTSLIERAVTRNAAATSALYVDSVVAPLLPDMKTKAVIGGVIRRALDETLGQGALGRRLLTMRLWAPDGTVLYSNNPAVVGRRFEVTPDLRRALSGEMIANFDRYDVLGSGDERPAGPVLEIYNPILQPWSGEVVAVMEFYERADEFQETLASARMKSWLAVASATALFFLPLSLIVLRGSRTIDRQARDLSDRVSELTDLLATNRALHSRVRQATQRAAALNENYLRRLGADLHDGPAQLIALASLRLDSEVLLAPKTPRAVREREMDQIRATLEDALREIRTICQGLVLPQIEHADLLGVVSHAIDAYEQRTGMSVSRRIDPVSVTLPLSQRICVYRFLQEALNNGFRHCRGASQTAVVKLAGSKLRISLSDDGPGFDPARIRPGSIGIEAMRERIESLGGRFDLHTSRSGTTVTMTLDMEENRVS